MRYEETYHDAPEHPSDVDYEGEWDNDSLSTLPVDVYTSPDKHFPRLSEDTETDSILSQKESDSSNLSGITITSSIPKRRKFDMVRAHGQHVEGFIILK